MIYYTNHSLDVVPDRKYEAPSEDRTHSDVIALYSIDKFTNSTSKCISYTIVYGVGSDESEAPPIIEL